MGDYINYNNNINIFKIQNDFDFLKKNQKLSIGEYINSGKSKTAYNAVFSKDGLFELPQNTVPEKLCIVKMQNNKNNENDIEIHYEFMQKKLAPEIYDKKIIDDQIFLLEEKCGEQIDIYIKRTVKPVKNKYFFPDNLFDKVIDLINNIVDNGYVQCDINYKNICLIINNGDIEKIIALDFESFKKYEDNNMDKEDARVFMLTQFFYGISNNEQIVATEKQLKDKLNFEIILFMFTFHTVCIEELMFNLLPFFTKLEVPFIYNRDYKISEKIIGLIVAELCKKIGLDIKRKGGNKKTRKSKKSRHLYRKKSLVPLKKT